VNHDLFLTTTKPEIAIFIGLQHIVKRMGDTNILEYAESSRPAPGPDEVLIEVQATALNRIDLAHRYGVHKFPQSGCSILGVEAAGEIVELGRGVTDRHIGDRVFGLVREAAAVPEVFLTASERLFTNGNLQSGQSVLIHAGGSGVGTAAIQLAHYVGAEVIVKRVAIIGNNLYLRNVESQREITKRFSQQWLPVLREGRINPIIDTIYPIEEAENAHQRMKANLNFGKIILEVTH